MDAPTSFDRKSILSMVDALYTRGARLPKVYGAMGFFIGFLLGLARNPIEDSAYWWAVPTCVGILCAGIGRMRGKMMNFDLRLRGQTALCQLELVDGIRSLGEAPKSPNIEAAPEEHGKSDDPGSP